MNKHNGVICEFKDKFGDTRIIRSSRRGLQLARRGPTPIQLMNGAAGKMIGKKIRELRIAAKMTMEELCLRSGLVTTTPKSRMWEIENSVRAEGVSIATVYAIAAALNVEAQTIFPTNKDLFQAAGTARKFYRLFIATEKRENLAVATSPT